LIRLPYSLSMMRPRMTRSGSKRSPSTGTPAARSVSSPYWYARPCDQPFRQQCEQHYVGVCPPTHTHTRQEHTALPAHTSRTTLRLVNQAASNSSTVEGVVPCTYTHSQHRWHCLPQQETARDRCQAKNTPTDS
jgi:hypothetical protein